MATVPPWYGRLTDSPLRQFLHLLEIAIGAAEQRGQIAAVSFNADAFESVLQPPHARQWNTRVSDDTTGFHSPLDLALTRPDLFYAEGLVASPNVPFRPLLSGWCVNADGEVIDVGVTADIGVQRVGVAIDVFAAVLILGRAHAIAANFRTAKTTVLNVINAFELSNLLPLIVDSRTLAGPQPTSTQLQSWRAILLRDDDTGST